MMGLRPSFFLFLLIAAAAAAAAALAVVAVAGAPAVADDSFLLLLLLPLADAPAAPVIEGASAAGCCTWGPVGFSAGRAAAFAAEEGVGTAPEPAPAPALSLLVCCPPFMVAMRLGGGTVWRCVGS